MKLYLTVFMCGAATMMLEMTGSRILAPYFGTSIFVWTNLIGVVLAFLSLGNFYGGYLADRSAKPFSLSRLILMVAVWSAVLSFASDPIMVITQNFVQDLRLGAFLAAVILFAFPCVFLGAITPYAAKLCIKDLRSSGKKVGFLYAFSTLGSIVGTFLSGLYLLSTFSNATVLLLTSGLLFVCAIVNAMHSVKNKITAALVLLFSFIASQYLSSAVNASGLTDVNTPYNRVWVYTTQRWSGDEDILMMQINNETSSLKFPKRDELAAFYTRFYRMDRHFKKEIKNVLMLGGAGYSYPNDFLKNFKTAQMDVVEIDPGVTKLAQEHFDLKEDSRLRIIHEDARTYLNRNQKKYDVIYGDVFRSCSVPFHLTTQEAMKHIYESLNPDGVFLMNVISSVEGKDGRYFRAQFRTIKSVFDQAYVFCVDDAEDGTLTQNLMIVAIKSKKIPKFYSKDSEISKYLEKLWIKKIEKDEPVLYDHFAPVEKYSLDFFKHLEKSSTPMRVAYEKVIKRKN